MQMSMRKLNSHTILQLWCCCHVMYKLLYPSIRVRTAPSVSVRVRVRASVSFTFDVTPLCNVHTHLHVSQNIYIKFHSDV